MLIGLDIGGTKACGVVVARDGRRLTQNWVPHEAKDAEQAVGLLASVASELLEGTDDALVGVSVGGLVAEDGRATRRGVFGFDDVDIGTGLAHRISCDVRVFNDADATLRAAIDAEPEVDDAVLLALGTGVGGSVMWHGRSIRGRSGFAGELGHMPVLAPLPYPCVCGGTGCLEQYAGGRGLVERARAESPADLESWAGKPSEELDAADVVEAARGGVASAVALIDDAARAVAQAIISLAVTTEPARVYIGGSVAHGARDLLLGRIQAELDKRWPLRDIVPVPHVALDDLGPYAAAIGAALLARDAVVGPPPEEMS